MRIVGVESGRNDLRFELLHSRREHRRVRAARARCPQRPQRRRRGRWPRVRLGVGPEHARRALARFAGVATALRVPRRDRRRHVRRRLRASSGRGARRARGRTRRRVRAGRLRLPAASLLPGGDAGGRLRRRLRGGRHRRGHRGLRGRRGATTRACRAGSCWTPSCARTPRPAPSTGPAGRTSSPTCDPSCGQATSASRSLPAISRISPPSWAGSARPMSATCRPASRAASRAAVEQAAGLLGASGRARRPDRRAHHLPRGRPGRPVLRARHGR